MINNEKYLKQNELSDTCMSYTSRQKEPKMPSSSPSIQFLCSHGTVLEEWFFYEGKRFTYVCQFPHDNGKSK